MVTRVYRHLQIALAFFHWAKWLPVYPFVAVLAWFCVPRAVARAEPWVGLDHSDITPATRARFQSEPRASVPTRMRLSKADRWLELHDDQLLPPGLYESEIAAIYDEKGWEATSIAFLRRNLAHGWGCARGEKLFGLEHRWSYGTRGTTETPGHWLGFVDSGKRVYWQWIGAWHVGGLSVEINTGWVIRDMFDSSWYVGRPARWRSVSLRIRRRLTASQPQG